MTESISDEPLVLNGSFVNLFDASLNVVDQAVVQPGERVWLLDLNRVTSAAPAVLASSCRIESLEQNDGEKTVVIEATSPSEIEAISLLKLDAEPTSITINGNVPDETRWDKESKTFFFKFHSTGKASIEIKTK